MEYQTLNTYRTIAQKAVRKLAPKFYPSLAMEIISNDEAFGEIVNAIITADWKWDENRTGKDTGKKKTLYSYRNQCVIWALKTYITNKYKKNTRSVSINRTRSNDDIAFDDQIEDSRDVDPSEIVMMMESESNRQKLVKDLFDSNILTDKQKEQIKLYYFHNQTLSEIGSKYGTTREAVRQNIKKGLKSIGDLINAG
jgi:RNA polymerase sigma factor (sigma-70 family)